MANVNHVKYYTAEKYQLVSIENIELYDAYLKYHSVINKDTFDSAYALYQRNFMYFLVFLAEKYDNIGLYSNEFEEQASDIMLDYMSFCSNVLMNNKKTINTKVSTVSSFFKWSTKANKIKSNPISDKIQFIPRAKSERIINDYFLTNDQINQISTHLLDVYDDNFDIQDILLWFVLLDSANRIGAVHSLDIDNLQWNDGSPCFVGVREKEAKIVDVSISVRTYQLIQDWIAERTVGYDLLTEPALFISSYGRKWHRMSRVTLQRKVRKIGRILGISDLHPHCIRKSVASNMLDGNVDSYLISKYLNHKSMAVLDNYIKPKSASEIREQIDKQLKR